MSQVLLNGLIPRAIAYAPLYRDLTGSLGGAILLSQVLYWGSKKPKFWKTDADMMEETGLTEKELRTAKRRLKDLPFINVTVEKSPPQTHYEVDADKWFELIGSIPPKGRNQSGRKGGNDSDERAKFYTSETSSETTPIPRTGAESTNGLHPRWKKYATELKDAIATVRKVNLNTKLSGWAEALRRLNTVDEIPIPRIRAVLKWYCSQIKAEGDLVKDNSKYLPVAYSGGAFREKFLRIEDAMKKDSKTSKRLKPQKGDGEVFESESGRKYEIIREVQPNGDIKKSIRYLN